MKKFIAYIIAAILVAFAIFAILFWLFTVDYSDSIIAAVSSAFAGLVVALLEPFFAIKVKEQEQSISERVRRGLHRTHRNDKLH